MKMQFPILMFFLIPCVLWGQNVGIGISNPTALLHVNGPIKLEGSNLFEFGAGVPGKEVNAGKIGYNAFGQEALTFIGAGTSISKRAIYFYAEGGTTFEGPINVLGALQLNGNPGLSGQVLTSNGTSNPTWQNVLPVNTYWQLAGILGTEIMNTNTGGFWSAHTDLVVADPGVLPVPVSGAGTRLMWIPAKSAFRAGSVPGPQWDDVNTGTWSFASGYYNIARGDASAAFGRENQANEEQAFVIGNFNKANGRSSFATGSGSTASGDFSASLGFGTVARSFASLAIGYYNDSIAGSNRSEEVATDPLFYIGNGSFSARHNAIAVYKNGNMVLKNRTTVISNPVSFATPVTGAGTRMMWLPEKSAFRAGTVTNNRWDAANIGVYSFAGGRANMASGFSSTALGDSNLASGIYSFAAGYRDTASGYSSTAIGTGYYHTTFFDIYSYSKANGYSSTAIAGGNAGGNGSIAIGVNALSTGSAALAGPFSNATGDVSIAGSSGDALGYRSSAFSNGSALGDGAVSMGGLSWSKANSAITMGERDTATGLRSVAIGYGTYAKAASSVSLGSYNDSVASSNPNSFIAADPLLILGNGTSPANRSNALVVFKNGNTDISGYTQLGKTSEAAPSVKMKKLTSISSASQNTWVNVPHGLTKSKILAVNIIMSLPAFVNLAPNYTYHAGYEYQYQITDANIVVINTNGNSANILGKIMSILITYEE